MELRDFISESLKAIIGGVKDAQKEQGNYSAKINPSYSTGHYQEIDGEYFAIKDINFEIALTESKTGESKKGISVSFPIINGNIGDGKMNTTTAGTKVSFSLPVIFPVPGK